MSIRIRLALWFAVCLLFVTVCLGFIVFTASSAIAKRSFNDAAVAQLQIVQERINSFLAPGIKATEYLAELDLIRDSGGKLTSYLDTRERTTLLYANHPPHERKIYDEFMRIKQYNDNFDLVFMANRDGEYAQAPEGRYKNAGYDPRKRGWWKELHDDPDRTVVSSPYVTTGADIVCSIMTKTTDRSGQPLGMVGVDYTLTTLTRDLTQRGIGKTGYLVVFDPNGAVVIDGHHPELIGKVIGTPEDHDDPMLQLRARIAGGEDGEYVGRGMRGLEEYVVTYTLPDMRWKLAVVYLRSELMESTYAILRNILVAALPLIVLTILGTSYVAFRISQPIKTMATQCSRIALGDIASDVDIAYRNRRDEVGVLARSLQDMIESTRAELDIANALARGDYSRSMPLRSDVDALGRAFAAMVRINHDTLSRITRLVKSVNGGAELVSDASGALTNGAETSAAALEEVAASVTSVDRQARENSKNIVEASAFAGMGRAAARRGYAAMTDLTDGMTKIQEFGKSIGRVVKLIDDIAFQTNLLSLNAAVEAARAGSHGKGFSVVATEVRNLAARSAKAAHETGGLIKDMVEQMVAGVRLAERSDQEFRDIVDTVDRLVELFGTISESSTSQSAALSQIVQSLRQIEEVTQENTRHASTLSEQAVNLSREADELDGIISHFRLAGEGRAAAGGDEGRFSRWEQLQGPEGGNKRILPYSGR